MVKPSTLHGPFLPRLPRRARSSSVSDVGAAAVVRTSSGPIPAPRRRGCWSADERPTWTPGSGEVEPIEVHHLVPRGHEVTYELLLRVVARVDLRDGSELRVRAEDEVDGGGGPLKFTRGAI